MDDFSKWTTGITVEQRCWNRVYNSPRKPRRFIYTPAFHQLIRGPTCLSACHPLYFHSSRSPPPCLLIESRLVLFRRGIARIFRARSAFGHTRTGGTYHRGKMRPRQINLRRHPRPPFKFYQRFSSDWSRRRSPIEQKFFASVNKMI